MPNIKLPMPSISIRNARENNLKNINVDIPKGKITVITGVSGSGKSSLAYDVIFKQAQRLFIESMSNESRRLLKSFAQVDVGSISGLSPVVAVNQKTNSFSSNSTVGTLSGVYDYLRLLMARFSKSEIDISPLKQQRRLFSFNTPYGACASCRGIGMQEFIDSKLIIRDENLSLREGALKITLPSGYTVYSQVTIDVLNQVCEVEGFNVDIPWNELTDANRKIILYGSDKIKIPFGKHSLESRMKWSGITAKPREEGYYRGILPIMEEILKRDRNANILRFVSSHKCMNCDGSRLRKEALSFSFKGVNMADFSRMDILEIHNFFLKNSSFHTSPLAFENLRKQIISQCKVLIDLGLGYLEIQRKASTLSSGELQRIRMANMSQSQLSGLLYIFDEPSVGLHSADQKPLIELMQKLKSKGNTVLLIEHEAAMIQSADHIIEIGPLAGQYGGEVIFQGSFNKFSNSKIEKSLTKKYLFDATRQLVKFPKLNSSTDVIAINNADINNLKSVSVKFKLNALNVVCGVSGSGKSSLVMDTLAADFKRDTKLYIGANSKLPHQIIAIDQKAIGRTPRSNPATYTKVFDKIRTLFAKLPDAKASGLKSSHFSFNTVGGRCEACEGAGYNTVGMHFIGNVEVKCDICNGERFKDKVLDIKYNGKNIKEVLDLRIEEAVVFFKGQKHIYNMLKGMDDLGLGYITLGQRATSLSGGEAQRVKLASEMVKNTKYSALYILDEPSTGLHSYDVDILLKSVYNLIKNGHTVIIIEHHEDIIKSAQHIVELGKGSGKYGG
ncbi:MAG: excinuclease ABC subunit UvrA, partial [Bacteroidales bacterium]|nr:excinuclease ABC subunit UvrA [Bacteroidales bacterium]